MFIIRATPTHIHRYNPIHTALYTFPRNSHVPAMSHVMAMALATTNDKGKRPREVYIAPVVPIGNQVILRQRLLHTLLTPRTFGKVGTVPYKFSSLCFILYNSSLTLLIISICYIIIFSFGSQVSSSAG